MPPSAPRHVPPESVGEHGTIALQTPLLQNSFAPHVRPHPPQFAVSVSMFAQAPPQHVLSPGPLHTSSFSAEVHVAVTHLPYDALHAKPGAQVEPLQSWSWPPSGDK